MADAIKKIIELDLSRFLEIDDGPDFQYCVAHGGYQKDSADACEFVFALPQTEEARKARMKFMTARGCTTGFIAAFMEASEKAQWALIYGE